MFNRRVNVFNLLRCLNYSITWTMGGVQVPVDPAKGSLLFYKSSAF